LRTAIPLALYLEYGCCTGKLMPRPYPPPAVHARTAQPFTIGEAEKRDVARILGLERLPPNVEHAITDAIAAFKATAAGSADTTVANTLAAPSEIGKKGRRYRRAVERLADDRSGVDYATLAAMQPLAKAVLANCPGAREALARAAGARAEELREHKRVDPRKESLLFCGILRLIFNDAAAPVLRSTVNDGWRHCRQFAMEVFAIAGIDHANFDAHPERLTEYLGTDVTVD
jgi:hypothetical protein